MDLHDPRIEGKSTTVTFDRDEALVLFDWLWHFSESSEDELRPLIPAEKRALWNLTCLFEKALVEPFMPEHDELYKIAVARLSQEFEKLDG